MPICRVVSTLFISGALLVAMGAGFPCAAAPATEPPGNAARPTAELYDFAASHLRGGKWYEGAIRMMTEATAREPGNREFWIALGCARASRAASIGYTSVFAGALNDYREQYPTLLAEWEKAQKDPAHEEYGEPKPEPPPRITLRTKDDRQLYRLTRAQAAARFDELAKGAKAAWEKALALSATPEARAEVRWTMGWGVWLLQRYAPARVTGDEMLEEAFGRDIWLAPKETRALFEAATREAPRNARYWQALGDVLAAKERDKARAAYEEALRHDAGNAPLLYRLYSWSQQDRVAAAEEPPGQVPPPSGGLTPEEGGYLRRAADADPENAYPLYLLACKGMSAAPYGRLYGSPKDTRAALAAAVAGGDKEEDRRTAAAALASIERGNLRARFAAPAYRPALPALVASAWDLGATFELAQGAGEAGIAAGASLRELARAMGGYAWVRALQRDRVEAERAGRAVVVMGQRLSGEWPIEDDFRSGRLAMTTLVGQAVSAVGYLALQEAWTALGDEAEREAVAAEAEALTRRGDEYRARLKQSLERPPDRLFLAYY